MSDELKTPEEWLEAPEFKGVVIMDPDGWRMDDAPKWDDPITIEDFRSRLMRCTVMIPPPIPIGRIEE